MRKSRRKSDTVDNHYVDSEEFERLLREYYDRDDDTENSDIDDRLATIIMQIANQLSTKFNFANYTWKDDMIGDALIKMYSAIKNKKFNLDSGKSIFAYYTTICWNSFIARIKTEQRHHKTIQSYKEAVYESGVSDNSCVEGNVYVKPVKEFELDDNE